MWNLRNRLLVRRAVLAVAALVLLPAYGPAASWLGFRNDTKAPIIVQGISVINRSVRLGKRHVLQPGEMGWDLILAPGSKLVLIADAKQPTVTLFQGAILCSGNNLFFSIQPDEPKKRKGNDTDNAELPKRSGHKVKLVPAMPPPGTPANPSRSQGR